MGFKIKKHYLVYKITNIINQKIYIGIHITNNIDDGYMGSGKYLKISQKKYGIDNFKKEILFELNTKEDMCEMESKLVDEEFIKREDTYNIILGGGDIKTDNIVVVKNIDGVILMLSKDDPKYLSGEFVGVVKDTIVVKNRDGDVFRVSVNDHRYLSGELVGQTKGYITVKDIDGNTSQVSVDDPRYLSGDLVSVNKGMVTVVDEFGNSFQVSTEDPRYKAGVLVGMWKGRKHKEETKRKIGLANSKHQKGEKNSQYGTCWIYNEKLKISKKINRGDYFDEDWKLGRKIKF